MQSHLRMRRIFQQTLGLSRRKGKTIARAAHGLSLALGLVAALALAGCASPTSDGAAFFRLGPLEERPAPSVDISRMQAWHDAQKLAALDPGRFSVLGGGTSMRPVYGEGTILVLQKVAYAELGIGMNVAYRSSAGRVVVHRLIGQDRHGWIIEGLNNATSDVDRVTPTNLLGVVYAAFAHDGVK
jgi:hypothetical protein